jgi:hypothetical protein
VDDDVLLPVDEDVVDIQHVRSQDMLMEEKCLISFEFETKEENDFD